MLRLPVVSQKVARQISRRWFATGTVKFYNRSKFYGFIIGDGIEGDIFCQRRMIAGAKRDTNLPFLLSRERVSFDLVVNEEGKQLAHNVKFEDGNFIPNWRKKYVDDATAATKKFMGIRVYDILDDEEMDEGNKVTHVMEEYENAKRKVADIQEKAQQEAEMRSAVGYAEPDTRSQIEEEEKEEDVQDDSKVTV